ncbi:MAG TPA: Gfo/Idh/MocA family oxidoreductase [Kiritimatiellia bacterium]|nr:Gfo/Idh/MocA family oxidoreductase [Kiritimatiellia bacterium]
MRHASGFSRRRFLASSAALATFTIPRRSLFGQTLNAPPGKQFRFAKIGCGGMGGADLNSTVSSGGIVVGLCDVDPKRAEKAYQSYPDVPKFTDYRKMLDKLEKEIDGVVISTPDHTHACAALDAMRRGKHVYVQKPLARTYEECRLLLEATRKYKVVTQMGNQGHAGPGLILWKKMMDAKAFGEIEQVHTWSDRPIWPQGMTEKPKEDPVPEGFDWDSWIGPASMRPFSTAYVPFKWRGWWDFGCGAIGDMACHNMDPAFWILQLGMPAAIRAEASSPAGIAYPAWSIIEFTFPATPVCPKGVKVTWYDGKKLPTLPANAHPELKPGTNGCLIIGSKMSVMGGSHAAPPMPIALGGQAYGPAVKDAERHWREELKQTKGCSHYGQWVEACKENDMTRPGSQFEYSVPMTQTLLLGCIALRYPGVELKWDSARNRFSNHEEANRWLADAPRAGFDLKV